MSLRPPILRLLLVAGAMTLSAVGGGIQGPSPSSAAGPTAGQNRSRVQVAAGWDGFVRSGRLLPVRITVTGPTASRRASTASGTVDVRVTSGNGGSTTTVSKLAPGREGTAQATVVVAAPRDVGTFELVATARRPGAPAAEGRATLKPVTDAELVGVLPVLAGRSPPPATAPLSVPIGTARFVAVDGPTLAVVGSLQPLGTLTATTDDLIRLSPTQRTNVVFWLASGGHLWVDSDAGPVPGLPAAWQPVGPTGRADAGLGEVHLTGGVLGLGRWTGTIEPSSTVGPSDPDIVAPAFSGGPVGASIARNSGLRIPSLGMVLTLLLGYVLLAGPVTFGVLHKVHRAELAWLVVPVLAVGFTVGGWVIGGRARDTSRTSYSSSVFETPGVDVGLDYLGVLSRQGGDRSIRFAPGWWGGNVANELYGRPEAEVRSDVSAEGTTSTVSLVGGEFAVLAGRGPTGPTTQLDVAATTAPGQVNGTVRNRSPATMTDVAVFVGNRATLVGALAPGQQRPWSLSTDNRVALASLYNPTENQVWSQVVIQSVDRRKSGVDLALWGETTRLLGPDLRSPGSVVAVGWSTGLAPAPAGGRGTGSDGRTAVVARNAVTAGPALTGDDVRRDLLRGPSTTPIADGSAQTAGGVFRFVLPAGRTVDPGRLVLSVPATLSRVDVWDGVRWQTLLGSAGPGAPGSGDPGGNGGSGGPNGPGGFSTGPDGGIAGTVSFNDPPRLVALPPGAVTDGVVYVRIGVRLNGPPNSAAGLLLRERP